MNAPQPDSQLQNALSRWDNEGGARASGLQEISHAHLRSDVDVAQLRTPSILVFGPVFTLTSAITLKQIFWICFLAAALIYVIMLTWTLPAITSAAGGNLPFDLRSMGYDLEDARMFLQALTPDGRQLYLNVQHKLDTAYPALMAIALGLGSYLLAPLSWKFGRWIGAAVSAVGAGFDFIENYYVANMLNSTAQTLDPELVWSASRASMVKSVSTTIAIFILLALLGVWLYRYFKARNMTTAGKK